MGAPRHELGAEILGQPLLEPDGLLIVDPLVGVQDVEGLLQLLLREPLHADEQPAAVAQPAGPAVDQFVDLLPAAQVEVANAEVGAVAFWLADSCSAVRERLVDVVEDTGHWLTSQA